MRSRPDGFRWIVRAVFWFALAYVYVAIFIQPAFKPFNFLLLNVLLAYVPIELSLHLQVETRTSVFWTIFVVWFFFYPNAPYVLTDFFHLAKYDPYIYHANGMRTGLLLPDPSMWLMFTNLAVIALASTLFGIWSLHRVAGVLLRRLGRKSAQAQMLLVSAISLFASMGIYLGRFPRLHTADLFLHPLATLARLAQLASPDALAFIALMTVLQLAVWGLLATIRRS